MQISTDQVNMRTAIKSMNHNTKKNKYSESQQNRPCQCDQFLPGQLAGQQEPSKSHSDKYNKNKKCDMEVISLYNRIEFGSNEVWFSNMI